MNLWSPLHHQYTSSNGFIQIAFICPTLSSSCLFPSSRSSPPHNPGCAVLTQLSLGLVIATSYNWRLHQNNSRNPNLTSTCLQLQAACSKKNVCRKPCPKASNFLLFRNLPPNLLYHITSQGRKTLRKLGPNTRHLLVHRH